MKLFATTLFIASLIFSCQKQAPADRLGEVDFSRPAAIGGRMMAGYHNGALYPQGQKKAIPQLLFDRIEAHGGGTFETPLMTRAEGIGVNPKSWTSIFQSKSTLAMNTDCEGVESLGPDKTLFQSTTFSDLENQSSNVHAQYQCAPFATLDRMLDPSFGLSYANGNPYPYYHRMASDPGNSTMIGELMNYEATFVVGWFGMEEVLSYAQTGGTENTLADPVVFEERLDSVLSIMADNGTKGVLLNIPDVKQLPYFQLVAYNGAELDQSQAEGLNDIYSSSNAGHIQFKEGENAFICDDPEAPQGIRQLKNGELLTLTVPLDSMKCEVYGLLGSYFKDRYYLSLEEVSQLDEAVLTYNNTLEKLAAKYDFALFDAHTYFQTVEDGVVWNGSDYTFEFVSGGFVSLDGIYPNQKGSALLTNEVIRSINSYYGTHIPLM
ncbi:MAG: hypothetical protein ACQERC_00555 [Bacteroidota bacterium]